MQSHFRFLFVIEISKCSGQWDNTVGSAHWNKSIGFFYSFFLLWIIGFVISGQFYSFVVFAHHSSWISGICAVYFIFCNQYDIRSTTCLGKIIRITVVVILFIWACGAALIFNLDHHAINLVKHFFQTFFVMPSFITFELY